METDNINSDEVVATNEVVIDTEGIQEALTGLRNAGNISNEGAEKATIADKTPEDAEEKPAESSKTSEEPKEINKYAAERRKEKIEALRKEKAELADEKDSIEKEFDAKLEAKLQEALEKRGIKEVEEDVVDEFEAKQAELLEDYETTGDIEALNKYNDNKLQKALADQESKFMELMNKGKETEAIDLKVNDMLNRELTELNETYGTSFKNLDELSTDDKYDEFMQYAEDKGVSIADAYFLVHKDEILQQTSAKAIKNANKRSHIKPAGVASGGIDHIELDALDLEIGRSQGFTDKQIARYTKKFG